MASKRLPAARQCRDYQARTERTVRSAIESWKRIFETDCPEPNLAVGGTCTSYANRIKAVISECPSSELDQVMAWQSIKKLLPASCRCMESNLLESLQSKLSSPSRALPRGYLRFVENETRRLFPRGWDRSTYEHHVLTTSPPLSSTTECSRSDGGSLGSGIDQPSFLDVCLGGQDYDLDVRAKMIVVQSAGKPRALTKFSADALSLRPLHKAIYDRLSLEKWLCRGDVTSNKIRNAGFKHVDGEVLTSGDYKSATDNLSIEVAEVILRTLLSTSVSVPESVKKNALKILRPNLYNLEVGIDFSPTVGQMMGSFLSFPLLCIQNRLAFLRCGGRGLPCLINGDDILFRSKPEFSQLWLGMVGSLGLEVEKTKTSVSESYGTLNSTLIVRENGKYKVRQTFRFGMLGELDDITSLSTVFSSFVSGISGRPRFRGAVEFFRWHLPLIKSQRLTTLELGFRGDLAWRVTRKFGLLMCPAVASLPKLGPDHNVVLPKECKFVDPATLTKEDKRKSAYELTSWKFSKEFRSLARRSKLSFLLKLSEVRPSRPCFNALFWEGTRAGSQLGRYSLAETRRWFMKPVEINRDSFPLMIEPEDVLPPYEDFEAGTCLVEVDYSHDEKKATHG